MSRSQRRHCRSRKILGCLSPWPSSNSSPCATVQRVRQARKPGIKRIGQSRSMRKASLRLSDFRPSHRFIRSIKISATSITRTPSPQLAATPSVIIVRQNGQPTVTTFAPVASASSARAVETRFFDATAASAAAKSLFPVAQHLREFGRLRPSSSECFC